MVSTISCNGMYSEVCIPWSMMSCLSMLPCMTEGLIYESVSSSLSEISFFLKWKEKDLSVLIRCDETDGKNVCIVKLHACITQVSYSTYLQKLHTPM